MNDDDFARLKRAVSELKSPAEDQDMAEHVSRDLDRAFDFLPWREALRDLQLTDDVMRVGWP